MRGRDESFCFRNARTRNKHSRHTRLSTQNARAAKWSPDLYTRNKCRTDTENRSHSHAHTPESWQPCPPMSHPANGSIMRVVCGSLFAREHRTSTASCSSPPPFLFVVPAASCLQTMVSPSPIVRVKSLVFLLASSLPSAFVCVCAHSPCHAIHYQPVARGLQLRPTALLNQK